MVGNSLFLYEKLKPEHVIYYSCYSTFTNYHCKNRQSIYVGVAHSHTQKGNSKFKPTK